MRKSDSNRPPYPGDTVTVAVRPSGRTDPEITTDAIVAQTGHSVVVNHDGEAMTPRVRLPLEPLLAGEILSRAALEYSLVID